MQVGTGEIEEFEDELGLIGGNMELNRTTYVANDVGLVGELQLLLRRWRNSQEQLYHFN